MGDVCDATNDQLNYCPSLSHQFLNLQYWYICLFIYLSDFVKMWPLGFCLEPGTAPLQASPVSKRVGGLLSRSVQLDSPGTALTVVGWIRPGDQN